MATIAAKLQLKPGWTVRLIDEPKGLGLAKQLPDNPIARTPVKAVVAFITELAKAHKQAKAAFDSIEDGGLVWIAYPKGHPPKGTAKLKSDVSRDVLAAELKPMGWDTVRIVAIDETWSALRFRPIDEVGK